LEFVTQRVSTLGRKDFNDAAIQLKVDRWVELEILDGLRTDGLLVIAAVACQFGSDLGFAKLHESRTLGFLCFLIDNELYEADLAMRS